MIYQQAVSTPRQTGIQTEGIDLHIGTHTDRQKYRQTYIQKYIQTDIHTFMHTDRQFG